MNLAVFTLILSNIVPLLGAIFFGWSLLDVMLVYWLENIIVGLWNVIKMLTAKESRSSLPAVFFICGFFCIHYGIFCFVHGMFVLMLFGGVGMPSGDPSPEGTQLFGWPVIAAAIGLFVSHGISYFLNYLGKGEYAKANAFELMHKPYGRMMVLHVTIVLGGWLVMALGQPVFAVILLVVLKIIFDIRSHRKSHQQAREARPVSAD